MSETLLSYAVSTEPDPLQVSPKTGAPTLATLTIVVSNDTRQYIECKRISFGFIPGKSAKDFFTDATGIAASAPAGWSIKQNGSLFTATPNSSSDGKIGPQGLTFALSNISVNEQPGTTKMTVTEVTGKQTATLDYPLPKFPFEFNVGPLTADPPIINAGDSSTLSWSGSSGATYTLKYLDKDGNIVTINHVKGEPDQPLPPTGTYTIDDIEVDTTFDLLVSLTVPGQDTPLTATRFFPVIVAPLPPNIDYFRPHGCTDKDCIIYASEFVLEWQIENATGLQLTATDTTGTRVIAVPWGSTSKKITQTQHETEYIMTIQNQTGKEDKRSVNVTLIPPVLVGTIVAFAGPINNLSAGWLNCNGQEVSGTTYPELLALLRNTYGTPRTNGNVVLPNLTGVFLRGVDTTGYVDPDFTQRTSPIGGDATVVGAVIGSRQGSQLQNHTHNWDKNFSAIGDGGDDIEVQLSAGNGDQGTLPTTLHDGGGNETRPYNVYVYYLIYGGVPRTAQTETVK